MQEVQRQIIRQHVVFSALIAVVTAIIYLVAPVRIVTPVLPYIFLFFFVISGLILNFLGKSLDRDARKFIPRFMGTITFKLLFYLGVMVVYALLNKEDAIRFVLAFAAYYLIYTVFDIILVLKHLQSPNK